ncbi:MAG TPA: AraC family transcriptional regulator [Clostridia bacterium]|nr:AraC family transcriptional regulator [Clostridia bacterium]
MAESLGFHDTAHFSTFFKQRTGKSPSSYRHSLLSKGRPHSMAAERNEPLP